MIARTPLLTWILIVWALLLLSGCGGERTVDASPALRFCAIPDQDETRLREKFLPVADYLSRELGIPVEYVHATSYSASVELFRNGDVLLAWFGGLTGVQARNAVPGARAIAQGEEDPRYYSYFIAHRDSGIEPGDAFPFALEGQTFTFGSESSTSGRLMPEFFIRERTGKAPGEFFSTLGFSGNHDKTAELVEAGTFTAGALSYKTYDRRVAEGQTDPDVCRVIWKTPLYADYNFTVHPDVTGRFGEDFVERLQMALVNLRDENLLSAFPRSGLIAADNEDFAQIETLARELDFIR